MVRFDIIATAAIHLYADAYLKSTRKGLFGDVLIIS